MPLNRRTKIEVIIEKKDGLLWGTVKIKATLLLLLMVN